MPSTVLKNLAKKAKISDAQAEHYWHVAKNIVKKEYDVDENDGSFWALTTGIAKKMMGLKESVSFKEFLAEESLKVITVKTVERAVQIIKQHCSKSLWMVRDRKYLWRGDPSHQHEYQSSDYTATIIDTSNSYRESQNTSNHYTVLLDNNPHMTDFPKRSKGLICSTDFGKAKEYSPYGQGGLAIIPLNDAKLGFVRSRDIWDVRIDFVGHDYHMSSMNDIWTSFGIKGNSIKDFEDFGKAIKNKNSTKYKHFVKWLKINSVGYTDEELKDLTEAWTTDFMKMVYAMYSPASTGMVAMKAGPGVKPELNTDQEVWIEGSVLAIPSDILEKVVAEFGK